MYGGIAGDSGSPQYVGISGISPFAVDGSQVIGREPHQKQHGGLSIQLDYPEEQYTAHKYQRDVS